MITKIYGDFEENEFCKIYPNDFFGYWRVTVEQSILTEDERLKIKEKKCKIDNGQLVMDKGQVKELKADKSLRDYENIPFLRKDKDGNLRPQTIEEYFEREVKPHLAGAWIDESKTKIGYEINFTKYFYEFKPLRSLEEIRADILALEEETIDLEKRVLES